MHLLTKTEQEAFLQVKSLNAVLPQGLCQKHDAGFGHFGKRQGTGCDIYATSEPWNRDATHLLQKFGSSGITQLSLHIYPSATICIL